MNAPTSAKQLRPAPSSAGKPPPHDLDAEAAVLADVFRRPERIADVSFLKPGEFYNPANGTVFEAMLSLASESKPIDTISVNAWLRERSIVTLNAKRAGEYLGEIVDKTPASRHASHHAQIVATLARRWRFIQHCQRIAAEGYGEVANDWIETSTATLASVTAEGPSAKFEVIDTAQVFAPLEAPVEVIAGCVREKSITLLAGFGSGSKTWQGLDACVSVALGQQWLGRFPCRAGRAAFVDFESGRYETCRRLQANARARGYDKIDGVDVVCMPGIYLGDERFLRAMEDLAKGRSLVVIDSLRAASLVDENDSRIRLGLDQLRAVAEKTGCAFIVLVHAKKSSGSPTQIDERELLRGSSAVFDAADVVFVSTYKKDDERFDVVQAKARHGRKTEPFSVRLVDERGGVTVRAEDVPEDESRATPGDTFKATVERVRQVLRAEAGCSMKVLRARVGGKATVVDGALEWLIDHGEAVDLVEQHGKRIDHHYRLTGGGQ